MKNTYTPHPVELEDIELPKELLELTESMARNVHEVWAEQRRKDGWTYGDQRDDTRKKHPCLVPYEELPESEREYDRLTAIQTVKLIYKLGFYLVKK